MIMIRVRLSKSFPPSFLFKMVMDADLLPPLITILQVAEFRTRKEAAWAITNATSGGSAEQIRSGTMLCKHTLNACMLPVFISFCSLQCYI